MNLFGLSPGELLLIMMVAMVVLGPEKLPEVAASLGKWIREFRRATEELTAQFADNNPIYELQRALSLTDEPAPVAPTEEVAPAYVEPVPEVQPVAATPATTTLLPSPVHGDYFKYPQIYPSVSDLWVHGSLPDVARRNGHAMIDVRPIVDEWTFGVPIVRPAPIVEAESPPEAEVVTAPVDDSAVSEAVGPEVEPTTETAVDPESGSDVAPSAETLAESPAPTDEASAPGAEGPGSPRVAKSEAVSHNGVVSRPSDESMAIPVPAGAGDGREGDHP